MNRAFLFIACIFIFSAVFFGCISRSDVGEPVNIDDPDVIAKAAGLTSIAQMSTGNAHAIIGQGDSAFERNSRIPVTDVTLSTMSGFDPISPADKSYENALRCLTQAIYYEAANEPEAGKRAVAQVVSNRLRHPAYPNSVCSVVYEGANAPVCQFSFTCDGSLKRKPMQQQWEASRKIAKDALSGTGFADVGTATHYHADYVVPKWAYTLLKLQVIGRHIFYRFPGQIGEPRSFIRPWNGKERIPSIDFARFQNSGTRDSAQGGPADWVPGLSVKPDPSDRHAANDVAGRIDTTKDWRLTLSEPDKISESYENTLSMQSTSDMHEERQVDLDEAERPIL